MRRTFWPAVMTALALLATSPPAQAGVAFFDDPTDTIQIAGQTVIGTASTYEAIVLFPSTVGDGSNVYNEWQFAAEDKALAVSPGPSGSVYGYNFNVSGDVATGAADVSFDTWHHAAYVYDGAEERVYLDGALLLARPRSGDVGDGDLSSNHVGAIFRDNLLVPSFIGLIDVLRLSDVARYTGASFTPPSPNLASDADTVLLYTFDEAPGATSVGDASSLGRTGTPAVGFGGATSPRFCGTDTTDVDGDFIPDSCDDGATTTTSSTSSTSSSTSSSSSSVSTSSTITTSTSTSTVTSTTVLVTTTITSTTATNPTTSTTTTLPGSTIFPPGKKLLVKEKKSGAQRLQMLARDAGVAAALPCEVAGELIVEAVGAGAPAQRFVLDAASWKPIREAKPERGCKYRKGPIVATVLIKAGKTLTIVAKGDDLGIPLANDPRPVRIELRHGDVRHCLEFGGSGPYKPGKKLLSKGADAATACPVASPSGAFVR